MYLSILRGSCLVRIYLTDPSDWQERVTHPNPYSFIWVNKLASVSAVVFIADQMATKIIDAPPCVSISVLSKKKGRKKKKKEKVQEYEILSKSARN